MSATNQPTTYFLRTNHASVLTRRGYAFVLTSFLFLLTGILLVLSGCSENGRTTSAPQQGKLEFVIKWPQDSSTSKLLPALTQSLVFSVVNVGDTYNQTQTINRTYGELQTVKSFDGIPVGTVTVTVTAYPEKNGAGVALAKATAIETITAATTTRCMLDPTTTIDHMVVNTSLGGAPVLAAGQTLQLIASAKNTDGNDVLLSVNGMYWHSSDTSIATVDQTGLVTAVGSGPVTISAMDRETGKKADFALSVAIPTGGLSVTLGNGDVAVSLNRTDVVVMPVVDQDDIKNYNRFQFTTTVTGTPNTAVEWSIQEAEGGSVDQNGLYTAPTTTGIFHVIATSIANPAKKATATVTVSNVYIDVQPNEPVIIPVILPPSYGCSFNADVTGMVDRSVTWWVQYPKPQSANGPNDPLPTPVPLLSNYFFAPMPSADYPLGTVYTIIARSNANPTIEGRLDVREEDVVLTLNEPPTGAITMKVNEKHAFDADVTGVFGDYVRWTVSTDGGTVDGVGNYTAPKTAGTYYVTASSAMAPIVFRQIRITVTN